MKNKKGMALILVFISTICLLDATERTRALSPKQAEMKTQASRQSVLSVTQAMTIDHNLQEQCKVIFGRVMADFQPEHDIIKIMRSKDYDAAVVKLTPEGFVSTYLKRAVEHAKMLPQQQLNNNRALLSVLRGALLLTIDRTKA